MGVSCHFKCNSCNYSTRISGGPDTIMSGTTNTYVCNNCHTLHQLLVEDYRKRRIRRHKKGDNISTRISTEVPKEGYDFFPPYCPECHSKNLIVWNPKNASCPKCNGKMEKITGEDLFED